MNAIEFVNNMVRSGTGEKYLRPARDLAASDPKATGSEAMEAMARAVREDGTPLCGPVTLDKARSVLDGTYVYPEPSVGRTGVYCPTCHTELPPGLLRPPVLPGAPAPKLEATATVTPAEAPPAEALPARPTKGRKAEAVLQE